MANTSRINGFKPVKHLTGAPYNGQANSYEIVAADATAAFVGDVVVADGGTGTAGLPTCTRGATTEITTGTPLGVIVGFEIDPTALDTPQYRRALTKRIAFVADSPDLIFEVEDGHSGGCTQTEIGLNCGYTNGAGSTVTGTSAGTTGATAPTTTLALPLKIMSFVKREGNEGAADYQKLNVMINAHLYGTTSTAI